jgi:hypothetical protein
MLPPSVLLKMSIFKICCIDEIEKYFKKCCASVVFFWAGGSWRVGRGGMEDIAAVIASWCAMSHRVGSFVAAGSDGRNIDTKRRQRKRKKLEEEEEMEKQLAELMD